MADKALLKEMKFLNKNVKQAQEALEGILKSAEASEAKLEDIRLRLAQQNSAFYSNVSFLGPLGLRVFNSNPVKDGTAE